MKDLNNIRARAEIVRTKTVEIDIGEFLTFGEEEFDNLRIVVRSYPENGRGRSKTVTFGAYELPNR